MKINIAKSLLELLLENGSVTIPGLGKFEMVKKAASFGEGRKSLLPPAKGFSFSEDHDPENEEFKNHLIKAENIDSEKAEQFLSKFTSNISKGLMDKQAVELAYVGVIRRNDGTGDLAFLPNSITLKKLNDALPEVSLPDPKAIGSSPKSETPTHIPPTAKDKSTGIKSAAKKEVSKPKPVRTPYEEPKERGCLPWILGAILLGSLLLLCMKMCSSDGDTVYRTLPDEPTSIIAANENSSETNDISNGTKEAVEDDQSITQGEESTSEIPPVISSTQENCIVVVASLQNDRNIDKMLNRIKNKNYKSYTETHGAYTRVGVQVDCDEVRGSYENYIRQVSKDFGVNAWSLTPEFPQ